jgi:hypothetical protein
MDGEDLSLPGLDALTLGPNASSAITLRMSEAKVAAIESGLVG